MDNEARVAAIREMSEYFRAATPKAEERIAHTLEVLGNAEQILAGEGVDSDFVTTVAILGALFHDIGIPESERKYRSAEPKYQHQEGPPITRSILAKLSTRPDVLERVCFIVGNHHSRERIDGMDFQIVYEADYIVNTAAGATTQGRPLDLEALQRTDREHLRTSTALRLIRESRQGQ